MLPSKCPTCGKSRYPSIYSYGQHPVGEPPTIREDGSKNYCECRPEASATPWSLGEEHESMCRIHSADGKLVAIAQGGRGLRPPNTPECSPHEIAERIVMTVNLHEELLKMLRRFEELCNEDGRYAIRDQVRELIANATGDPGELRREE